MEAAMALHTDQTVEIYPNGLANIGKANRSRRWKGFFPNYDYTEVSHGDYKIIGIGDTAMCCAPFKRTFLYRGAEKATVREGRNFFVLKKINGTWKIALNHWVFD